MGHRVAIALATAAILLRAGTSAGAEALTMDEAVEAALAANPEVAAAIHEYEATRARAPQAATPPDPMFMADFMGVPTNTADVSRGTIQYMVEQEIPFPSKLAYGYRAERRAAEAALSRSTAVAQEVRRQVKRAYAELWRVGEEERISRAALSAYRQGKASSEEAYASDRGKIADPVRASVGLGEIEARLAILGEERIEATANLSRAMARPLKPDAALKPPPPLPPAGDVDELIERAKAARPEVAESARMAEAEGARLSLAKSQYAPDLTLRWGFMDNPAGQPNAWSGRAGISVPLWSLSKQRYGVRESKAMLSRARSMEEAARLEAEADVRGAHAKLAAARKASDIYGRTVVPRARLLVKSAEEAYRGGDADFLGLVDAIRARTDAEVMHARARADAVKAAADLERAVGTPIEAEGER